MTLRMTLFWIAVACCAVAELAILRSVLFGAASTGGQDSTGPSRAHRSAEIAWAVIPAIGLLFVLYLTWRALDAPRLRDPDVTHSGATIGA